MVENFLGILENSRIDREYVRVRERKKKKAGWKNKFKREGERKNERGTRRGKGMKDNEKKYDGGEMKGDEFVLTSRLRII